MNKRLVIAGIIVLALIGGAVLLAGSGVSDSQPSAPSTENTDGIGGSPGETNTPQVKEFKIKGIVVTDQATGQNRPRFDTGEIRVKKGDTVRIEMETVQGFHDWTIDEFNARTKQLAVGQKDTVEFVADKAGTFQYYCSVPGHKQAGMVGNLIVEE